MEFFSLESEQRHGRFRRSAEQRKNPRLHGLVPLLSLPVAFETHSSPDMAIWIETDRAVRYSFCSVICSASQVTPLVVCARRNFGFLISQLHLSKKL